MMSSDSVSIGTINSPKIEKGNKPTQRSVDTIEQASELISCLKKENSDRNKLNARIMAKYNDARPFSRDELAAEGLLWKSNFSSHPLSILIDRVAPRFVNALNAVTYLTNSKLPEEIPGASKKTDDFRKEVTSTIRARPEWKGLINEVAQENALFGYTGPGWTDEFKWFPTHFRQDNFFIPPGTKQYSKNAQVIIFCEHALIHEVFDQIKDLDAAKSAGWDTKNTIEVINNGMPDRLRSKFSDEARVYEDLVRETTFAASFSGARVVVLDHLFVVELDGKVSHWIVDWHSHKQLFRRDDQFDSMEDVAVFFSFQHGNGTMHGSKGIGRLVYEMAGMIDRARNEVVDRLQLAGKLVVQGDDKMIRRFKASVIGPAIVIDSNFQIAERRIEGDVKSFFELDQYMGQLLDQIAGNVSPKTGQVGGEALRSKAAWDLLAAREEEGKDQVLARFLSQASQLITAMQKRMCASRCSEKDAQAMQERLLKTMSREELDQLAEQPSVEVVKDYTDQERQKIILVATEGRGNPAYNQKELERRKVTAAVGASFAESVLMPDNDPTEVAEQTRLQRLELLLIGMTGQVVEVSPRDNHRIHLDLLKQSIESAMQQLAEAPDQASTLRAVLRHARLHVQAGAQVDKQNFTGDAAWIADIEMKLRALSEHDKAVQAATEAGAPPEVAAQAGIDAARPVMEPQPVE